MSDLTVYAIGMPVVIGSEGDEIGARVIGISIYRDSVVKYEVVWWDDRLRRTAWLEADEVKPHGTVHETQIGFIAPCTTTTK